MKVFTTAFVGAVWVVAALAGLASGGPALAGNAAAVLPGNLLVADAGNDRIVELTPAGDIVWEFPVKGSLPAGMTFRYPDDAFFTPDGEHVIVNEEANHVVALIDYRTRRLVWWYGTPGRAGSGPGQLHTPDDAYQLPDGRVVVADIGNCRVLVLAPPPAHRIERQFGTTGVCRRSEPPRYLASPNGDTPLPNGHLLITEIRSHAVTELTLDGTVVWRAVLPARYPSDAQLTSRGTILVADYVKPGRVIEVDRSGRVVWSYGPRSGPGMLDHPSLAIELPTGPILVTDDHHHRILAIDRASGRILWQYGHLGRPGRGKGYLNDPDGLNLRPVAPQAQPVR